MPEWYREEIMVAIGTKTVLWYDLSPEFKDARSLPARDTGIDSANETVAVQVKCRPTSKRVDWSEIAKFIASAKTGPKPFEKARLITDSDVNVSKVRDSVYERWYLSDKTKEMITAKLHQLVSSSIGPTPLIPVLTLQVTSPPLQVVPSQVSVPTLRDYQLDILQKIESGKASSVSIPCGTGKSYIMAGYIDRHRSEKTVIFVPTILLLEQMCSLLTEFAIPHQGVGTGYTDQISDVAAFISSNVYVCVYNSAYKLQQLSFDAVFIDEAHHVNIPEIYESDEEEASSCDEVAKCVEAIGKMSLSSTLPQGASFANVLKSLRTKRTLYFSATLDKADCKIDLRQMINDGHLSDYDIHIPCYSSPITDEQVVFLLERHSEYGHALLYSNRCERAKSVSDALNKAGILCGYFDGTTPPKERLATLESFKRGDIRCLSTVNTLGEGIDIKIADACIFIDHRNSKTAIVQCAGRILRRHPEKIMAHVVISACDDEEPSVCRFMRAIIGEDSLVMDSAIHHGCRISSSAGPRHLSISADIQRESPKDDDEEEFDTRCSLLGEGLYTSLGKCLVGMWEANYYRLLHYVAINHKSPPRAAVFEGFNLGRWVDKQRQAIAGRRTITPERVNKLLAIKECIWSQVHDAEWMVTYEEVDRFCETNRRVPFQTDIFVGKNLGMWATYQRTQYRQSKLSPDRIALLNELTGWYWDQEQDEQWNRNYEILLRYVAANHFLPRRGEIFEGVNIGDWVHNRQQTMNGTGRCTMTAEIVSRLEAIPGWTWHGTGRKAAKKAARK